MQNAWLNEAQTGIKIAGRNINNRRYKDDTTLMAESEEELQSLLMKVKGEHEKASLKFNIQQEKKNPKMAVIALKQLYKDTTKVLGSFSLFTLPPLACIFFIHASKMVLHLKGWEYCTKFQAGRGRKNKGLKACATCLPFLTWGKIIFLET